MRRILVTSALPYANGHIHIGHLVEYLQTDIWVRFQKLRGRRCIYICADDTHGTAIMIRARQEGIGEEELIAKMRQAHVADFTGFDIEFDNYGSTNSPETREFCVEIWAALRKAGLVEERKVTQLYDAKAGTFLADRFVKGTCPKCQSPGQYGDSCDKCGAHYNPTELIDPVSTLSGTKPEIRQADHLFVNIEKLHAFLEEWTQSGEHLQPEIANYLTRPFPRRAAARLGRFAAGALLRLRDSRQPGQLLVRLVRRPDRLHGLDAAMVQAARRAVRRLVAQPGRRKSTTSSARTSPISTRSFGRRCCRSRASTCPSKVHIHGFLTVNGEKMSKSKGTFIRASTYLKHLDPSYLRYYYASKLSSGGGRPRLELRGFHRQGQLRPGGQGGQHRQPHGADSPERPGSRPQYPDDTGLFEKASRTAMKSPRPTRTCDFSKAMRLMMAVADRANKYIDDRKPWEIAKKSAARPETEKMVQDVCTIGLNLFRQLAVYLSPVLPQAGPADRRTVGRSDHAMGAVADAACWARRSASSST